MKKYIVLSVNDNVDYLYFTPLVCWAWRRLGWEPLLFFRGDMTDPIAMMVFKNANIDKNNGYQLSQQDGYRSDTITQISRLYAGCVIDTHDMVMTGDIDMIPLSDYWKPKQEDVTVYGHDLTGYGHYPICYIAMDGYKWAEVMNLVNFDYDEHIKRDLDTLPQAKDLDFYKYWFSDQDLITARLNEYGKEKITFINRGQGSHGYARGRIDRGSNGWVLDQPELIDAHLMQQTHHSNEKIQKLMDLLHHVWPKEDWKWFLEYTKEFKKLSI
jgi:hypothetical protein